MSEASSQSTTQIKLLVNTAGEAVEVLKKRYGEHAKVLSVKQVEVGGLKRLISKPRLEVIVEIPSEAPTAKPESTQPADTASEVSKTAPQSQPVEKKSPVANMYAKGESTSSKGYFAQFEDDKPAEQDAPVLAPSIENAPVAAVGTAANPVRRGTIDAVTRAISMLESVGFDRSLIERVRAEVDFKSVGSQTVMDLYPKICDWLRNQFPDRSSEVLGTRRAFIGCCGVGKTAALSKMLSNEVFIKGLAPTVLKVDSDIPNASDALEIFSEIMGSELVRSLDEVESVSESKPLLVDMPGYTLSNDASIMACRDTLDELEIDERILVINAAYEAELIAEMLAAGEAVGATRVVFTHLDECRRTGKLWKFLLNGRIKPLFFSEGPNPAGDYTTDTYSFLLDRSFPNGRALAAATRRAASPRNTPMVEEATVSA